MQKNGTRNRGAHEARDRAGDQSSQHESRDQCLPTGRQLAEHCELNAGGDQIGEAAQRVSCNHGGTRLKMGVNNFSDQNIFWACVLPERHEFFNNKNFEKVFLELLGRNHL